MKGTEDAIDFPLHTPDLISKPSVTFNILDKLNNRNSICDVHRKKNVYVIIYVKLLHAV